MPWRHSGTISTGPYAGRWRTGRSIQTLASQVDNFWPKRWSTPGATVADGTLGDTAHQNRSSDHNPNIADGSYKVVTAIDITDHDASGQDMALLTEALRRSRDPRIKYVIHDRDGRGGRPSQMFSSYPTSLYPAWTWRPYSGSNPHVSHAHISVQPQKSRYDDASPFKLTKEIDMGYTPTPENGPPRDWANVIWEDYVEASGTDPTSRNWLFFREDLAWVWQREIVPLHRRLSQQASLIANLQNRIKALETANTGGALKSGTKFSATID